MSLQDEFQFYLDHQDELVVQYNSKFLIIKDQQVQGAFDEEMQAYAWAVERFTLGSFLLQKCSPGEDSYSQTFYSRIAI